MFMWIHWRFIVGIWLATICGSFTAHAQSTRLIVAYASPSASFSPAWIAKLEGLFGKYDINAELVLMQGASTYLPALASGNIHILYGGGTAVSRAIATGGIDLTVIGSETRYVPLRLMTAPTIRKASDLKAKRIGVGSAGLDEYATVLYLERIGLTPGKDVGLVYLTGGIPGRVAAMKQGLIDAAVVNPPNEYELEKLGFRELVNFLDLKMPYAGVPYTVMREYRNKNRALLENFMTAIVHAMHLFRTDKSVAYKAIIHITRLRDPILLERTYLSYLKQYEAIGGLPYPWETGIESMITGFHARFTPAVVKNKDAKPFLDPSFVQKASERLGLAGR